MEYNSKQRIFNKEISRGKCISTRLEGKWKELETSIFSELTGSQK